ncbi:hypothetical protein [Microbacterium sp. PA5]|uniref:hypothetical protein n=1 Tax=Microbacterium sp. PA5 TaxID=3416654 RepID=UPI003CE687C1
MSIPNDATPTAPQEIWFKPQRVLRTIVQVLTAALSVWAAFVLIAPQVLAELAKILPGSWVAWLAGVIASITVVAGVLTRIMAISSVNAWLTKIGLGSVPKRGAEAVG